jgi:hypothetical protein
VSKSTKTPPTTAATLTKIERNTDRIATALERMAFLVEKCTFRPHERVEGGRYIRVHSSND